MSEVVCESDTLTQVFIETECTCKISADAGDFECVRETSAVMVVLPCDEDLSLSLESAEGLCLNDAPAVALEGRTRDIFWLRGIPTERTMQRNCMRFTYVRITEDRSHFAQYHTSFIPFCGAEFQTSKRPLSRDA